MPITDSANEHQEDQEAEARDEAHRVNAGRRFAVTGAFPVPRVAAAPAFDPESVPENRHRVNKLEALALTGTFCNLVGVALKRAPWAPDWLIPFVLPVVGGACQWGLTDRTLEQVIHGAIAGSAAVGVHQAYRNGIAKFSNEKNPSTPPSQP